MSCNLQKLAGEISEYLGTAGGQVHVVLDAHAAPTGTIDPWLDRHYRALAKRSFDGLRQARRLVHLQPETMAEAVAERVAITLVLDVAASESIGLLTLHSRAHGLGGYGVGVAHDIVDRALIGGCRSNDDCPRDVRAIALVLGAKVEEQQIATLDYTRRRACMRQRGARSRGDDRGERKILTAFVAECVLENPSHAQLRHAGP